MPAVLAHFAHGAATACVAAEQAQQRPVLSPARSADGHQNEELHLSIRVVLWCRKSKEEGMFHSFVRLVRNKAQNRPNCHRHRFPMGCTFLIEGQIVGSPWFATNPAARRTSHPALSKLSQLSKVCCALGRPQWTGQVQGACPGERPLRVRAPARGRTTATRSAPSSWPWQHTDAKPECSSPHQRGWCRSSLRHVALGAALGSRLTAVDLGRKLQAAQALLRAPEQAATS